MGYYHPMNALGDPGLGKWFRRATRVPKSIRKLKVGRALASVGTSFLPGPIGAVAKQFGGSCAGDPGFFSDLAKGAGRVISGIVGGKAGELERKAAEFLQKPVVRAGAAAAAAAGLGAAAGYGLSRMGGGGSGRRRRTVVDITAVRRAMGRLERFEKLAKKVVHFTHPTRAGATVARFKKGRRR